MNPSRTSYPSDVTDDEWAFAAPYLTLMDEDAPQRRYPLREVFNARRWPVRTGSPWRYLPHDLPPWPAVYRQTQRWPAAACFEAMADDLRALPRVASGRDPQPTAAVLDGKTLQATPESGHRAGYDGHKHRNGSKLHAAVDTLTLTELDGRTLMTVLVEHPTKEGRDMHIESGMEDGMNDALDLAEGVAISLAR